MATIKSDKYNVTTRRDIKDANARMQRYFAMLTRKNGATGREMMEDVGGFTPHNSWSLSFLAERYGFDHYYVTQSGRGVVHQMVKKGTRPTIEGDAIPTKGKAKSK